MTSAEFEQGFVALNKLAEAEYHSDLDALYREAHPGDAEAASLRVGRLVGVILKEPFAVPQDLGGPSPYSGAYRAWELVNEGAFYDVAAKDPWQLEALQHLAQENGYVSPYQLALHAHHERGFFGFLARSTAKYVCGDQQLRDRIKKAADDAKASGINVDIKSPEVFVASGGMSLGVLLVQSVPILGIVGAPVIAGLVLIVYKIGVDAFCDWTRNLDAPLERT